jgi:hypothetical protein
MGNLAPRGARLVEQPKPAAQPEFSKKRDRKTGVRPLQAKGDPVKVPDERGTQLRTFGSVRRSALDLPSASQHESGRARRKG